MKIKNDMIGKVIGLALALMIIAIVVPLGLTTLGDVSQTTTHTDYSEVLGVGDGVTLAFEGTLSHYPIDTGTATVTATVSDTEVESTGSADELTLDETTGEWSLLYVTNGPDDDTNITIEYDYTNTLDTSIFTLLTVLLPIIAVIGIVMLFIKRKE